MLGRIGEDHPAAATIVYDPELSQLKQLLETLAATSKCYVFVNGPQPPAVEQYLSELDQSSLLRSATNIGQGAALNAVVERAIADGARCVALFDQDSTPYVNLVTELRSALADLKRSGWRVAAVGPKLVAADGYLRVKTMTAGVPRRSPTGAVGFLPTSGTLIDADAWREIGPFRADYFIGGIDVEWGYRAWSRGWSLVINDKSTMVHRWGEAVHGRAMKPQIARQSPWRSYLYVRNAAHGLTLRHMPVGWKAWQVLRFLVQLPPLSVRRDFGGGLVLSALKNGYHGHLGPAKHLRD